MWRKCSHIGLSYLPVTSANGIGRKLIKISDNVHKWN
uniref:Uncharacterized protein n=1 Tax=Siphoviridae sp. ctpoI7 TaxID=2825678 RepID=A0A8S5P8N2_9CAUD|nr:MAG TPA: hypothetical protein [Siphoviridae sp. ctpoI7]